MLERFGTDAALQLKLPEPLGDAALAAQGADRYLSAMTQRVFQAGVRHEVVDAKWPAFEQAFSGFDVHAMARLTVQDVDAQMGNSRIIRDRTKLQTIAANARFILDLEQREGCGFGAFIARWPAADIIGLWRVLAQQGSRLGGRSGAGFLRLVGKDSFLLTSHVVQRLVLAGVVPRAPGSQHHLRVVQEVFNALQQESGRPLCQLSAMLAFSIPPGA